MIAKDINKQQRQIINNKKNQMTKQQNKMSKIRIKITNNKYEKKPNNNNENVIVNSYKINSLI